MRDRCPAWCSPAYIHQQQNIGIRLINDSVDTIAYQSTYRIEQSLVSGNEGVIPSGLYNTENLFFPVGSTEKTIYITKQGERGVYQWPEPMRGEFAPHVIYVIPGKENYLVSEALPISRAPRHPEQPSPAPVPVPRRTPLYLETTDGRVIIAPPKVIAHSPFLQGAVARGQERITLTKCDENSITMITNDLEGPGIYPERYALEVLGNAVRCTGELGITRLNQIYEAEYLRQIERQFS